MLTGRLGAPALAHGRPRAQTGVRGGRRQGSSLGDLAGVRGGQGVPKSMRHLPPHPGSCRFSGENCDVQGLRPHAPAPAGAAATARGQSVGAGAGQTACVCASEPRPFTPRSAKSENLTQTQDSCHSQSPRGCVQKGAGGLGAFPGSCCSLGGRGGGEAAALLAGGRSKRGWGPAGRTRPASCPGQILR